MKRTNLPFLRQLSTSQKKVDPVQEALMKENVIRVDRSDNALGPMTKRDSHLLDASGKSALHRAFSLFIFNHKNELLLQQRSDVKFTFPGLWTNSCCSHPLHVATEMETEDGFGAKVAARRRSEIELGIPPQHLPLEKMHFLTRIIYSSPSACGIWGENELDYILLLKANPDLEIRPNQNEVKNVEFVKRENLLGFVEKAKSESGITPWFELIVKSWLPQWWENLDNIERFYDQQTIKEFS